jgi:hypothetical protein
MNYPIWEIPAIGGGTLIALIAVLHVYISHLAVGGGLFIWLTDRKGFKENNPEIHSYVYKHTWFFLLLTMVFGGLSGVGIWFIIALVNPAATSSLIHSFVFGWAIEWVFFVGEITSLLVYYYKFHELNQKSRMILAFLYFLFAWLSLVIINGIITYMLTPGKWLETRYFWHGFFNPTYFASLFFRSFAAFMIAGLFGYVTTVFLKESKFRSQMMRYSTKWMLYPLIGLFPSAIWYYFSIPFELRYLAFSVNPQTATPVMILIIASILIFVFGIILALRSGILLQRALTFILLLIGLGWMAGFEYTREVARKPFIINQYMYSTSILKADEERLNREGILKEAKWSAVKQITTDNEIAAGKELFNIQCLACHTVGGFRNDIIPLTENFTYLGMLSLLNGQGKIFQYMPQFVGTGQEKEALAAYLTSGINKNEILREPEPYIINEVDTQIPPFNLKNSKYILLVWNNLGMHCVSDSDPWFVILPPANTLEAQLIKRGPVPEIITDGFNLSYQVEAGYEYPTSHTEFWNYSEKIFGVKLEEDLGLKGKGLSGSFDFNEETNSYIASYIPVLPYKDDGTYNPYPLFTVWVKDVNTGETVLETKVVAPTSTEIGCRNCHGGDWRVNDMAGFSDETAVNILKTHDQISKTNLYEKAVKGEPMLCQNCHADPILDSEGKAEHLNFSAAMHGFHANYAIVSGAQACVLCHPAYPKGRTRCSRGLHGGIGLTCVECHSNFQDHALALLRGQIDHNRAQVLMKNLEANQVGSKEEITGRMPWLQEPDCLTCHQDFEKPLPGVNAFNVWNEDSAELYRMRTDNAMIRCPACHGSTHALYPATNFYGKQRDNIQPMQYSSSPFPIGSNITCEVCHIQKMEDPIHHENMSGMFRNVTVAPE